MPAAGTAVEVATVFFRRRIEVGTQNVGGFWRKTGAKQQSTVPASLVN